MAIYAIRNQETPTGHRDVLVVEGTGGSFRVNLYPLPEDHDAGVSFLVWDNDGGEQVTGGDDFEDLLTEMMDRSESDDS